MINPKPKFNPKAERAFLASLSANEARQVAGSFEKLARAKAGESLEAIYNEGKDKLYQWKRVGDIIKTQQLLPVQQAMAIDRRKTEADLDRIYSLSKEAKPDFDQWVTKLADRHGGRPILAAIKERDRAVEKALMMFGGDAEKVRDIVRATIAVDTVEQLNQLVADLQGIPFDIVYQRNLYEAGRTLPGGYQDAKLDIRFGNIFVELQINTEKMIKAKDLAHPLYEQRRTLAAKGEKRQALSLDDRAEIQRLDQQMQAIFDQARRSP